MSSRSTLPSAILALLAEGPMHPYGIQRCIRERRKHEVINVAQRSVVYQAIRRLHREGLIRPRPATRADNRPERTPFELTEAGRVAASTWLRRGLAEPLKEFPEFPAVLSFLDHLPPDEARQHLRARLEALAAEDARLAQGVALALEHGVPRLFLVESEYLRAACRAEHAWVESLVADLESGALAWSPESVRAAREGLPDASP